jgi:hypothetical protein
MVTTIQFDALGYMRRLESAGIPKEQAEVHAQALFDVLGKVVATPRDLLVLERNIMSRVDAGEFKLSAEFKEGLSALKVEFGSLRGEFGTLKGEVDTLKWMAATSITLSLLTLSLCVTLLLKLQAIL